MRGLLDHRRECLLRGAPGLEKRGQVRALAQLADRQVDAAGPGLPGTLSIAGSVGEAIRAALAGRGAGEASISSSIRRSAAKAKSSRTRSPSAPFSIRAILLSVIVVSGGVQASQLEPEPKTGDDHLSGDPLLHHSEGHDLLLSAHNHVQRREPSLAHRLDYVSRRPAR